MAEKYLRRLKLAIFIVGLAAIITGCTGQGVTIYKYNGDILYGKMESGDFESEEIILRTNDGSQLLVHFNEIRRIEMGPPPRTR